MVLQIRQGGKIKGGAEMRRWSYWWCLFLMRGVTAYIGCMGVGLLVFQPTSYFWLGHWADIPFAVGCGMFIVGAVFAGVGFWSFWQLLDEPRWEDGNHA